MKAAVNLISVISFDFDYGTAFASIAGRLHRAGYAAILSPTYSHLRRDAEFIVRAKRWDQLVAHFGSPEAVVANRMLRLFTPEIIAAGSVGAPTVTRIEDIIYAAADTPVSDNPRLTIGYRLARPWPRWRVTMPLATPWVPDRAGEAAAAEWTKRYLKTMARLGLFDADQSCGDPSRLFYDRRWPKSWAPQGPWQLELADGEPGPKSGIALFDGPLLDIDALLAQPLRKLAAEDKALCDAMQANLDAAAAALPPLPGYRGKTVKAGAARRHAPWLVQRPDGREVDLTAWHHHCGQHLMLATLIEERSPEWLADRGESGDNVHILCPASDDHGSGREDGTFCWDGVPRQSRRGGMFCNHSQCIERGAGEWLHRLIDAGILDWDDLDQIEGRARTAQFTSPIADLDDLLAPSRGVAGGWR